jgi:hypothetical protein
MIMKTGIKGVYNKISTSHQNSSISEIDPYRTEISCGTMTTRGAVPRHNQASIL